MSDPRNQIPTFEEVMHKDTMNGKVPSFADVMGEEPEKKNKVVTSGNVTGTLNGGGLKSEDIWTKLNRTAIRLPEKEKPEVEVDKDDPIGGFTKTLLANTADFGKVKGDMQTQKLTPEHQLVKEQSRDKKILPSLTVDLVERAKKEAFPTTQSAITWLNDHAEKNKGEVSPSNTTANVAKEVIEDKRKVVDAIDNSFNDFGRAAVEYYGGKDDLMGEKIRIMMEKGTIPEAMKGNLVYNFSKLKPVQEWAHENHENYVNYSEQKENLFTNYPDTRKQMILEKIAQGREDLGYNNPILNLVGKKSSDEIINTLVSTGDLTQFDKNFYEKEIRPNISGLMKEIPTPGVIETAYKSGKEAIMDVPSSVMDITGISSATQSTPERVYDEMQKDYTSVNPKFKGVNRVSDAVGNLAGIVLPIGGEAKILQGANIIKDANKANQLMMAATFYHGLYEQNLKDMPNNEVGAHIAAILQTGIYSQISKVLPSLAKNVTEEISPTVKSVMGRLSDNKITGSAAADEITNAVLSKLKSAGTVLGDASVKNVKMATEMGLATVINDNIKDVFSGKHTASLDNGVATFEAMLLGGGPLSLIAARGANKRVTAEMYNEMAERPEHVEQQFKVLEETHPELSKQIQEYRENFSHLMAVHEELKNRDDLSPEQKIKEQLLSVSKKILETKIKNSPNKALNIKDEKELAAIEIEEKKVLNPDMGNKEFIEEMYDEDLLPKGSKILLEDEKGKFSEHKVGEYLKFVAQQANNLGEDWKPHEGKAPSMSGIPEQVIEVANERWAKEIEADNKEAEVKIPEVAEPTVSSVEGGEVVDFAVKENNVNLQNNAKASENIATEENQGAGNSTQAAIKESPEKERKLSERYSKIVDEADLTNPYDTALKYFADGGKINPSELERIFGGKGDKGARIGLIKNDAGTVKQIAHFLWESDQTGKYNTEDYLNAVESALSSFTSKSAMQKDLVERYDWEAAQEKYREQAYGNEAIDIVEKLTDEEVNHILQLDADKSREVELENFVNEKETTPIPNETKNQTADNGKVTEVIETTGEGTGGKEPPKETVIEGEGNIGGITHAANEVRRKDRALPEYQKEPQTFEAWNNEAEKAIKDGYDVEKLMDKIQEGHDPTPVENSIRKIYIATLDAEIAKNPTDALLAKQKRFIEIGDLANSRAGRNLVSLKGENSPLESISDFYVAKMEAAGVDKLTEQQKKETKESFDNVQKADANADAALTAYREEIAKLKAENELLKQTKAAKQSTSKGVKKTREDFVKERVSLKEQLAAARKEHEDYLKEQGIQKAGLGSFTGKEAKIVAKIVKSYADEGFTKLAEVVDKVLDEIKDVIPSITKKDIHYIIAGEYNEKKPTRSELAARMRDLRDEAYYINKLERLLSGTEPKNEKKKVKRNKEITDLREKIEAFKKEERDAAKQPKEEVPDEVKKLQSLKKRNEKEEQEIIERIAKGDFETKNKVPFLEDTEMQKKFPKEYNATLDAIKKKEYARHEFDIALLRDEMSRRSLAEKGTDFLSKSAGTVKAITTGIDDSAVAIQTYVSMLVRPRTGLKAFYQHIIQGASQKKFDRWLTALHSSSDFKEMKDMGLDVTEPSSLKEREKEEIFNNRFDGTVKIKGKEYKLIGTPLRPFERAFTTLGNVTRVVGYRTISAKYKREGYTVEKNPELFKSLATRLNTETGRGKVNEYVDMANKVVTLGIWSPKLMATKFNLLGVSDLASLALSKAGTKGYYRQLHPKERLSAILDVVQFSTTVLALSYGFALSFGGDIDTDPLSSTFMDIKLPNGKSYNFTGGFSGYIRSICQFAAGKKTTGGIEKKVNPLETAGRFFRGKTPPLTSAGLNIASGRNYMGQPTDPIKEAINLTPISMKNIFQQIERDGAESFFDQGIPTFFGLNIKDSKDFEKKDTGKSPFKKEGGKQSGKREGGKKQN